MDAHVHLINHTLEAMIAGVGAGGIVLAEVAANYGTSFITVVGEIIIACISGYCLIKVAQLKAHINSRMDELLKLTKESARAEGVIEGKSVERAESALIARGKASAVVMVQEAAHVGQEHHDNL